jgi:flagellar assembly protein FliH
MSLSANHTMPSDELSAAAWQPPIVDGPRLTRRQRPTAAELEGIERIAWDEGFAKGHETGRAAGEKDARKILDELRQKSQHLDGLMRTLAKPMEQLDETMEQLLVQLSITIAKHLVRRELRIDPSQVIAIVRDAVTLLPLGQRNVRVHLHPADATVVRECLSEPQSERAWTLVEDPVMSRGGCRVSTDTAQIDARLEARIALVVNQLLGDDRLLQVRSELDGDAQQDGDTSA